MRSKLPQVKDSQWTSNPNTGQLRDRHGQVLQWVCKHAGFKWGDATISKAQA